MTTTRTTYRLPFNDKEQAAKAINAACRLHIGKEPCDTPDYRQHVWAVAEWMVNQPEKWLFLGGMVGTGKTTFVKAISTLIDTAKFTTNLGSLIRVKRILARDIDKMDDNAVEEMKSTPILAIDDFGLERQQDLQYGNIRETSTEIIEHRYDKGRLTLFTSNFPISKIESRYGKRIFDRMAEMCIFITFTNKSYRNG